jgi:acetyltransferase, GNAT family
MVPADDEHMDSTEATSDTNKKEREPAGLTPMPGWLMKWWIPILLALILLAAGWFLASIWRMPPRPVSWWTINPYWPPSWPFNYHWPSKDAMALCATIAGGGFAFSAWQQRSHDNAANAKQARAAIERDDYWKRREQIFQILGSNNPGLRLGAVALLAELADSAAHSILLNETEKQQLQHHIIDTLCLQVRHEGLCIEEEGDEREHTTIQQNILTSIFQRIKHPQQDSSVANWSESTIGLNDCTILPPISIRSIITNSTLDLRGTTFEKRVEISESIIKCILWTDAHFNSRLDVTNSSDIGMTHPPTFGKLIHFRDTTIRSAHAPDRLIIPLAPNKQKTKIEFTKCRFYDTTCKCPRTCECRRGSNTKTCQCSTKNTCTCKSTCINTTLWITTPQEPHNEEEHYPEITIRNCTIGRLRVLPTEIGARMTIKSNLIHDTLQLLIDYGQSTDAVRTYLRDIDKLITLEDNVIQIQDIPRISPIVFQSNTYTNIDSAISFNNMWLRQGVESERKSKVHFQNTTTSFFDLFHFTTHQISDHQDTLKISWDTGSPSSTYHKALACNFNQHDNLFEIQLAKIEHLEFVTHAYEVTRNFMSEYAMEADWPEDHFSVSCAAEDIEHSNCYIVYKGDIPSAAFTLTQISNAPDQDNGIHWRSNMNHYTIQRISAAREYAVVHSIFGYAATRANYLRCLTHERNSILRHALEVFGFKECGTFVAEDGSTRIAYDWIKEPDPQD